MLREYTIAAVIGGVIFIGGCDSQTVSTDAAGTISGSILAKHDAEAHGTSIRPFRAHVSDKELADLRQRIAATRWPDKETVAAQSQGPQLSQVQELVRYWGNSYDWRKAEAKLNALPQFMSRLRQAQSRAFFILPPPSACKR
jgi:hypothetical protein